MFETALNASNKRQIVAAGARYTPGVDADAPNLQIESILDAIYSVSLSPEIKTKFSAFADNLEKKYSDKRIFLNSLFQGQSCTPDSILKSLRKLSSAVTTEEVLSITKPLPEEYKSVSQLLSQKQSELYDKSREEKKEKEEKEKIEGNLRDIRELFGALTPIQEYLQSAGFEALSKNILLIKGEWGTGKTHFLCDIISLRVSKELPCFFVLSHRLPRAAPVLDQFLKSESITNDTDTLLNKLNEFGKNKGQRSLFVIDAINEGNREVLKTEIEQLITKILTLTNVALVISCRTPFEQIIFTEEKLATLPSIEHVGFQEIEFEAQKEFFKYYNIPLPEVPLLSQEFSRPLFLKVVCESLKDLSLAKKKSQFGGIASGQVGFTYVLEKLFLNVGRPIEERFSLPSGFCWQLCKQSTGIAGIMASSLRTHLYKDEMIAVLNAKTGSNNTNDLLDALVTEGLLVEDIEWNASGNREILRLPYEKFSDHIIARHLLTSPHIDYSSAEKIRKSLLPNTPIGSIFALDQYGHSYKMPSLAEAIMLEFPIRVGRKVPSTRREIIFYLPKEQRLVDPSYSIFLDGLYWRHKNSFCKQTVFIINTLLRTDNERIVGKTLDTLFSLATKRDHPFSAKKFYKFLASKSMPVRDRMWSEFIRKRYYSPSVRRLLDWSLHSYHGGLVQADAENFMRLLSLCLTSTDKALRDEATQSIQMLGKKELKKLFSLAIESLTFNDSYVPERMLAASYGAIMAKIANLSKKDRAEIKKFSKTLITKMFVPSAQFASKHALIREYAKGCICAADYLGILRFSKTKKDYLVHPMKHAKSPFPRKIRKDNKKAAIGDEAFRMDFENYTIGSLIKKRRNYDDKHPVYQKVKNKIAWRIADLGFSKETFGTIDEQISGDHWRRDNDPQKVERYGKKYSWIAYFEMMGDLEDTGYLKHEYEHRTSKVDIDPSFPEEPKSPNLQFPNIFQRPMADRPADWMINGVRPDYRSFLVVDSLDDQVGPWIAIDGYVDQESTTDPRTVFTFIDALFVDEIKKGDLIKNFLEIEYPGNDAIPRPHEDHYTYAGEIPWSPNFAPGQRTPEGKVNARIESIFTESVTKKVKKKVKPAWREFFKIIPSSELEKGFLFSSDDEEKERFASALEIANAQFPKNQQITGKDIWDIPNEQEAESGFRFVDKYYRIPGIQVEIPVHSYSWESYHSKFNNAGGSHVPTPSICEKLGLLRTDGAFDFVDKFGSLAASYRRDKKDGQTLNLLFLRQDLLEKYLSETNRALVWFTWGERRFKYDYEESNRDSMKDCWDDHKYIHKGAFLLENGTCVVAKGFEY